MKKALLLALLLLLPIGFSCYNNSVTITSINNLEKTYAMLLLEERYNIFSDDSFMYTSLNDSSANIKVSNDSIIIQSFNSSADWESVLTGELYSLWSYNATSLSEEDIIFISNNGCCGSYNNGQFINDNRTCSEEIIVPKKDDSGILAVLIAAIPFLIILFYYARLDYKKYLAFLIGGFGWLIAFMLRLPLVNQVSLTGELWMLILVPSLLSGLFEETMRFLSIKYLGFIKKSFFLFAMGWSFFEVVILYCLNILSYLLLNQQVSFINALPGLVERFSATLIHLGLTIIVLKSINNKKLLALAMLLHFAVNLLAVIMLVLGLNVWIIEITLIFLSFWIYYISNELKEGSNNDKGRDSKKIKRKK